MAYLLRTLLALMFIGLVLTFGQAQDYFSLPWNHIQLSIVALLFVIFVQAFVMFYFIGVSRLTQNVWNILNGKGDLVELFENPPEDLDPYLQKVRKFVQDSTVCKRQTLPWTMLILTLGSVAFLLGGAHDTGLVSKTTHVGLVYGFFASVVIGLARQWYYLGKGHLLLRQLKTLFGIAHNRM